MERAQMPRIDRLKAAIILREQLERLETVPHYDRIRDELERLSAFVKDLERGNESTQ